MLSVTQLVKGGHKTESKFFRLNKFAVFKLDKNISF